MQDRGGEKKVNNLELIGWLVFTFSACAFLASSVRGRDLFAFCGSLLFLLGCLLFLTPLLVVLARKKSRAHGPLPRHEACREGEEANSSRATRDA